jgi:hypothetical protein
VVESGSRRIKYKTKQKIKCTTVIFFTYFHQLFHHHHHHHHHRVQNSIVETNTPQRPEITNNNE